MMFRAVRGVLLPEAARMARRAERILVANFAVFVDRSHRGEQSGAG